MPNSGGRVESERKNPFTIAEIRGGKLLCLESVSRKGRINSQLKGRFQMIRGYALDSTLPSFGTVIPTREAAFDSAGRIVSH